MSSTRRNSALVFAAIAALAGWGIYWMESQPQGRGEVSAILSGALTMLSVWVCGIFGLLTLFTAVWNFTGLRKVLLGVVILCIIAGSLWVMTDGFRTFRSY